MPNVYTMFKDLFSDSVTHRQKTEGGFCVVELGPEVFTSATFHTM